MNVEEIEDSDLDEIPVDEIIFVDDDPESFDIVYERKVNCFREFIENYYNKIKYRK